MIREIIWSHTSRFDLARLRAWVERYSPEKAQIEARRILAAVNKLAEHPRLGKRVTLSNNENHEELRELLLAPYVIRYAVSEKTIGIVRLWHYREERNG